MRIDRSIPVYNTTVQETKGTPEIDALPKEAQQSDSSGTNSDILQYIKQNPEYKPTVADKAVIDAIEKVNKKLMGSNTEVRFSIHKETKEIMIKVINAETKETIREVPSEKILDMVAKMCEMAGIIVDEKR